MNIYNNADTLASIAAIGGFFTTIYFAIKETPDALDIIEDSKNRIVGMKQEAEEKGWNEAYVKGKINEEKLYLLKDLAINYAPAIVSGTVTVSCIAAANKIGRERRALTASAVSASNLLLQNQYDKIKDICGPKKEDITHSAVNEDRVNKAPTPKEHDISLTGKGDTLCAMEIEPGNSDTMIFFRSSPQAVESARNEANAYLIECDVITQADVLYFMGLKMRGSGTQMRCHRMYSRDDLLKFRYDTFVYEKTKEPVLFIEVKGGWEYS